MSVFLGIGLICGIAFKALRHCDDRERILAATRAGSQVPLVIPTTSPPERLAALLEPQAVVNESANCMSDNTDLDGFKIFLKIPSGRSILSLRARQDFGHKTGRALKGAAVTDGARQLADRIRSRRNALGLNQKALAELAGFSALQTVSQIEKGQRDVKAWELVRLARALRMSMTDLLADTSPGSDPVVMWRNQPAEAHEDREVRFLERCRRYAHVANAVGTESHLPLPKVQAAPTSFDWGHAQGLAQEVWQQLGLGTRPAAALIPILEERYGIQIWYMDLGKEGSAACVVGDFGAAILMNSSEAPWRRNFSFGHELFHIITWGSFPPDKVQTDPSLEKRMESLANAFSSSLLLPAELVIPEFDKRVFKRKMSYADLIGLAREFDVSTEALLWRLYTLRRLEKDTVEGLLDNDQFRELDRASMRGRWRDPSPLPERFVRLAFLAYQKGRLSRSRLAQYLETSLPGLSTRLMEYGLDDTADYSTAIHTA